MLWSRSREVIPEQGRQGQATGETRTTRRPRSGRLSWLTLAVLRTTEKSGGA